FGFVHLDCLICGVHLISAFTTGGTNELLTESFVHSEPLAEGWPSGEGWTFFYVNIFVDRDIFMHYWGGGISHKMTQNWDEILRAEGHHDPPEDSESEEDEPNKDNVPGDEESGDSENEGIEIEDDAKVDIKGESQFEGAHGISNGVDDV
ncbi:hypothetical protein OG21DRAFT_1422826, partial [Imleria badia]